MSVLLCLIPALIAAALCVALPQLILTNLWRITELIRMPDVTQVLAQLQEAAIAPSWLYVALCALLIFGVSYLLRRHKIIAALLVLLLIIAGAAASLLMTYVNGVPVHTMVKIALEYLRSGAF